MIVFQSLLLLFLFYQLVQCSSTCILPFVVKPCEFDGKNVLCEFSLNSRERKTDCSLQNVTFIFITFDIELFMIPQYFYLIISNLDFIISKLIIKTNLTNDILVYVLSTSIRIDAIEISTDIDRFEIYYYSNSLNITLIQNNLNKTYWHLQIKKIDNKYCKHTVLTMANSTRTNSISSCDKYGTSRYNVILYDDSLYPRLDNQRCFASRYKNLVCFIKTIGIFSKFELSEDESQYETIYISVCNEHTYNVQIINKETFIRHDEYTNEIEFITKHAVIIFSAGTLQLSPEFFDGSESLQIRIEHSKCTDKQFHIDLINDTLPSITQNLFELGSDEIGATQCHLDFSEYNITFDTYEQVFRK